MSISIPTGSVRETTFDRVLSRGGEAGALIRSIDWSTHPLGPIESWPQSLKTSLGICLASRTPILVWWGPELYEFYNDAYRQVLGQSKHPRAMGERGEAIWPEIWHVMSPIFEGVLSGGPAVEHEHTFMLLDRHGFLEETYFDHAHCPILGEDGEVAGIFTTVTETTERVLADRRLRVFKNLAEAATCAETSERACSASLEAVGTNTRDVPFALLYTVQGDDARLSTSFGLEGEWFVPPRVSLISNERPWPFAAAAHGETSVISDIGLSSTDHLVAQGCSTPARAMLVPVALELESSPALILVAGLSPHLTLDDDYRDYLHMVARQLGANVSSARAREEQARRLRALEELDHAKTVFFDNVSHEFRTPLTLMLGPLEDALATKDVILSGDALRSVHRNTHRLLRLVNRLLDLSRIESGRLALSREPTDLAAYTADLASGFRSVFEQASLFLVVDCAPLPHPVSIDRDLWEKVVLNLLSNALKFTFEGGVTVTLRGDADTATLIVSDTGVGIPEEELPRIFERFHRAPQPRARSHEGAGIGLSLSRDLVRLHGGTLTASSLPGLGSAFVVKVPFGPLGATATPAKAQRDAQWAHGFADETLRFRGRVTPTEPLVSGSTPPGVAKPHIVFADDNADMREYVRRILSAEYALTLVADGDEALLAARREPPDLVLADVTMPRLDGFELLDALRADERTSDVPVILLSARAGDE
ncbi:MAG TPA: ATP-binding protein, partial [Polyangiaceae bacterium]|nr:ATP-binding protein [Polyangiaceae bacterium]